MQQARARGHYRTLRNHAWRRLAFIALLPIGIAGCGGEPVASGGPRAPSGTLIIPRPFTDSEMFHGVMFAQGPVASHVYELRDLSQPLAAGGDSTDIAALVAFHGRVEQAVEGAHPGLISSFNVEMRSGDAVRVHSALVLMSDKTLQVMQTMPEVRQLFVELGGRTDITDSLNNDIRESMAADSVELPHATFFQPEPYYCDVCGPKTMRPYDDTQEIDTTVSRYVNATVAADLYGDETAMYDATEGMGRVRDFFIAINRVAGVNNVLGMVQTVAMAASYAVVVNVAVGINYNRYVVAERGVYRSNRPEPSRENTVSHDVLISSLTDHLYYP